MNQPHDPADVDVRTAHSAAEDGLTLLDVREQHEWDAGHAPGAVHMPASRFDVSQLPSDRVLVICRSGNRSGQVVQALTPVGFDVVNVAGGMLAWADAGLPMVSSGPHEADAPTVM
ncbi:rhodanese-like domain-containing protein [Nocardioidaceae bacterium]|nr:rhodanese-like domain-containing protein [Nocardioidaceae bacterium]